MTNYVVSITIDNVVDAFASFLTPLVGGATIFRSEENRVAMPTSPCVKITEILQQDLETPSLSNDSINQLSGIKGPKRIDLQLDFYGENAGDLCAAVKTAYRTTWATEQFSDGIKPLYCSDGTQAPLVTGEEQYERRWVVTATLQYNPVLIVPQQSATAANVIVNVPVDAT